MSRLENLSNKQAHREREGRDHLEIDQRLQPNPADALEVAHRGDAVDHGAKDHRRDHHLDQCDEAVAERLQFLAEIGKEIADENAECDRDQDLDVEDLVPGLMPAVDGWLDRDLCHMTCPGTH